MDKGRGKWQPGTGCVIWAVVLAALLCWAVLYGLGWLLVKAVI